MSESHYQVNPDGTTSKRKTVLWPGSKNLQEPIIRSLFEHNNWKVSEIKNQSGSFWKVISSCNDKICQINLYISSIRDEDRQLDEFKMQLGTSYPENEEPGWITLVLGIYTIAINNSNPIYILAGYDRSRYEFSTNPSLRGTRTSGLQKAYTLGMYKNDNCILFRPEFIYYYIDNLSNLFEKASKGIPFSTTGAQSSSQLTISYLTALRTKPFMLLAGISGTGKSRIVRELAFKSCPKYLQDKAGTTPGNYCMIEVKPNWHDSTELLGYYSRLGKAGYQFTKFVKFLVKAKMFPTVPFFVCLDEMNLAPVEQYFAEILSILETRKHPKNEETGEVDMNIVKTEPIIDAQYFRELSEMSHTKNAQTGEPFSSNLTDRDIYLKLFEINTKEAIEKEQIAEEVGNRYELTTEGLTLPDNVVIIGTVNMDDTTHQFSRKVIDRAMTIEMNGGNLRNMFGGSKNLEYLPDEEQQKWQNAFTRRYVTADEVLEAHSDVAKELVEKLPVQLEEINKALKGTPFEVSYRVLNELTIMVGVMLDEGKELDDAIAQSVNNILLMKILPRIEGDAEMFALSREYKTKVGVTYDNRLEWLKELAPDIKETAIDPTSDNGDVEETADKDKEHQQTAEEKIQEMIDRLNNQEFTRFWP